MLLKKRVIMATWNNDTIESYFVASTYKKSLWYLFFFSRDKLSFLDSKLGFPNVWFSMWQLSPSSCPIVCWSATAWPRLLETAGGWWSWRLGPGQRLESWGRAISPRSAPRLDRSGSASHLLFINSSHDDQAFSTIQLCTSPNINVSLFNYFFCKYVRSVLGPYTSI